MKNKRFSRASLAESGALLARQTFAKRLGEIAAGLRNIQIEAKASYDSRIRRLFLGSFDVDLVSAAQQEAERRHEYGDLRNRMTHAATSFAGELYKIRLDDLKWVESTLQRAFESDEVTSELRNILSQVARMGDFDIASAPARALRTSKSLLFQDALNHATLQFAKQVEAGQLGGVLPTRRPLTPLESTTIEILKCRGNLPNDELCHAVDDAFDHKDRSGLTQLHPAWEKHWHKTLISSFLCDDCGPDVGSFLSKMRHKAGIMTPTPRSKRHS